MNKHVQQIIDHVWGPTGSVILHILLIFLLINFLVFEVREHVADVEVKLMEIEGDRRRRRRDGPNPASRGGARRGAPGSLPDGPGRRGRGFFESRRDAGIFGAPGAEGPVRGPRCRRARADVEGIFVRDGQVHGARGDSRARVAQKKPARRRGVAGRARQYRQVAPRRRRDDRAGPAGLSRPRRNHDVRDVRPNGRETRRARFAR